MLNVEAGVLDEKATESLRRLVPKRGTRQDGSRNKACLHAGYLAKTTGKTVYVYMGNSFMHPVWRVSVEKDHLNPVNNTGKKLLSITPDLTVSWHEVIRPGYIG